MTESTNISANSLCLICNGKKIHYDFSLDKYRVEECANCGMLRLNPQPTNQELAKIYNSNYFLMPSDDLKAQAHVSLLKANTANHYLNLLESYVDVPLSGSLLEIGCGHGDLLVQAVSKGLTVTGVEYSAHAVEVAAKKLGDRGRVICGEVSHLLNSKEQFDYIIFADVLEHVRDPREFLRNVRALLRENGIIVVIVPSIDSLSARLMNNKWMEFKPEHLWYFSKATLKRLLYSESFGALKVNKAKKTLSIDYITEHFDRYPVQPFTGILQLLKRLLPQFLRRYPIRVGAGGIITLARKQAIQPVKKLSIIMAAFNEEKTIQTMIERILAKQFVDIEIELIIVESKSTDMTGTILRQYEGHHRIKIIWQDQPRGKGNAVRDGLKHATGDFILIQDADDEYDLEDYDALLEPLIAGEAAFVLGARHGGRTWKMRKFSDQRLTGHILNLGHWFFTFLVNIFFGLRLKDPFTMYKVFRTDCLHGLKFECDRFDFDYELLIKLVRNGYKPIEIPVNYRSRSFKEGKKIRVIQDPLTWLRAIIKFRLQKI